MTLAGLSVKLLGVSDAMKSHQQKCDHVSDDVKAWVETGQKTVRHMSAMLQTVTPSAPFQTGLQRFIDGTPSQLAYV